MSHWTTIKTQIKDPEALHRAVSELGFEFKRNAPARGFYNAMTADFAIILPKECPYDIAVQKQPDGTYALVTDWWNGHVEKLAGKDFRKLIQLYGVHKATVEARKKGLLVQRQNLSNGGIKLSITGATI